MKILTQAIQQDLYLFPKWNSEKNIKSGLFLFSIPVICASQKYRQPSDIKVTATELSSCPRSICKGSTDAYFKLR